MTSKLQGSKGKKIYMKPDPFKVLPDKTQQNLTVCILEHSEIIKYFFHSKSVSTITATFLHYTGNPIQLKKYENDIKGIKETKLSYNFDDVIFCSVQHQRNPKNYKK